MSERISEIIKKIILYTALLAVMAMALFISSGKVRLIFSVLTIASLVFSILQNRLDAKKRCIAVMTVVILGIVLNCFYNVRNLGKLLPMSMTTNQMIYQKLNEEEKSLPDAYIRDLIKDKTIVVRNDIKTYDQYDDEEDEDLRGNNFKRKYFVDNNYVRYFNEYAVGTEIDESLPGYYLLTAFLTEYKDEHADEITELGYANDLLRYSFLLNREGIQESAYFWYAWYYYTFAEEKSRFARIRLIDKEGCESSEKLVAIWDYKDRLFLMPDSYYKNELKPAYDTYMADQEVSE